MSANGIDLCVLSVYIVSHNISYFRILFWSRMRQILILISDRGKKYVFLWISKAYCLQLKLKCDLIFRVPDLDTSSKKVVLNYCFHRYSDIVVLVVTRTFVVVLINLIDNYYIVNFCHDIFLLF